MGEKCGEFINEVLIWFGWAADVGDVARLQGWRRPLYLNSKRLKGARHWHCDKQDFPRLAVKYRETSSSAGETGLTGVNKPTWS